MSILLALVAHAQPDIQIRLRIQRDLKTIELTGSNMRILAPGTLLPVQSPDGRVSKAHISKNRSGKWFVRWKGIAAEPEWIESDILLVQGDSLSVSGERVPRDLEIYQGTSGYDVVVRLDLESYLAGVIPSEMPASWPAEALKAQSVAARSFALRARIDRQSQHYDLDSTTMDQVYKFLHETESKPEIKEKILRVLHETRGLVLVDAHDRVLKAYYSADCGCQSEDPKFVWGALESFQSVKDPSCAKRKPLSWGTAIEKRDVRTRLISELSLPEKSNLKTLQIGGRTPSGRVAEVVAAFDIGGATSLIKFSAQKFREIFGFEKIRSADFSLKWLASQLFINGKGYGHGVGLCQRGAKTLAQDGMDFRSILKLYYPKAKLRSRNRA